MGYQHTQKAPLHLVLDGVALVMFVSAFASRSQPPLTLLLTFSGAVVFVFALSFRTLTVEDEGSGLSVRFGPLPLFGRRVAYSDITAVAPGLSSWIDGWGIHYVPFRGWTYNLWGFRCVVFQLGSRTLRIGTDDAEDLAAFVKTKIASGDT